MTATKIEVCGKMIQWDKSGGQGHCWVACDDLDCPASIQEEIAAEIIDGKVKTTDDFVASNGQHYKW